MSAATGTIETPLGVVELVERARGNDRAAEAELCRRFAPAVRAFARRRLASAEAIDEFSQDVMLLLLEALRRGGVEEPARLGGFVLGICRNLALDRVRQRERRDALWQKYGDDVSALELDAPSALNYDVLHLEDCLSQLSQRARDVVRLTYVEAASHAEIAASLATTEANARVLRHRSLLALRECMSKRISWEAA
ncbi:MAG TPA: sigma-70 family RNA polymerase sigma factor [Polyangiaceae bacterium]|nr:sigma-70 family RNA polymerase sigma factor [Polyangiaceae bacterium]